MIVAGNRENPGFFVTRAIDDAGAGIAEPDVEILDDDSEEWVNPAVRENLERTVAPVAQSPDYSEFARQAAAETARRLGYDDPDAEPDDSELREAFKREIMQDLQGSVGEMVKPQLVGTLVDTVCKGLGPEARAKVQDRLGRLPAAQLSAVSGNADALEDLRDLAVGAHNRSARKKVSAPASEGGGSTRSGSDGVDDRAFEEWQRNIGGPVLNLDRDAGRKTFAENMKGAVARR